MQTHPCFVFDRWPFLTTITHKIFKTNSSFFCEIAHYGKSFISVFEEFSASINKTFILAARLGTRLLFYEI